MTREKALVITGVSRARFIHTQNFFLLAGAAGWVGNLRCRKLPGKRFPWEIVYRGPFAQQFGDVIATNRWSEKLAIVFEDAATGS